MSLRRRPPACADLKATPIPKPAPGKNSQRNSLRCEHLAKRRADSAPARYHESPPITGKPCRFNRQETGNSCPSPHGLVSSATSSPHRHQQTKSLPLTSYFSNLTSYFSPLT